MATAVQKIKLNPSRDIPFNKLVLSQSNVRRVKAGVSIEQLAESIALRTLLQSLSVRAVVDADGQETGMFEVPAGGRRYRALELLVKQKRMSKTQAVPCVVGRPAIRGDDHTLVATAADRSVNGRSRIPEPRGLPRKSLRVLAQNVMHTGGTRLPPAVARSSCFVGFFEGLGFLGESPSLSAISY